jgi:hypothetical protein
MPALICPRCHRTNPDLAVYCYFDGVVLQAGAAEAASRLPHEFVFPSGRRCRTFDELAQGCQEEWAAARDLLVHGDFGRYFSNCGRIDLARSADESKRKAADNADLALSAFVDSLPGNRTQQAKLDLHPRRILIGSLLVGESRRETITLSNLGSGVLQGTVAVTEGQDWLRLSEHGSVHECNVSTPRQQEITLHVATRGIAAGQTYGAKLTVVTNGGVVEVPLRMDLVAQPFSKAPFQGARTQRELAERMKDKQKAKAAVPLLESGEVRRWFELNGWTWPVSGPEVKGVAAVQQFFEGLGLSKPPPLELSSSKGSFTCRYRDRVRVQFELQATSKKWVYAQVTSQQPWIKVQTPQVSGPQHTKIELEIDTSGWTLGPSGEGTVELLANGGQKLLYRVAVDVPGAPAALQPPKPVPNPAPAPKPVVSTAAPEKPLVMVSPISPTKSPRPSAPEIERMPAGVAPRGDFVSAMLTVMLLFLCVRLILVPFIDFGGRSGVVYASADKLGVQPTSDSAMMQTAGWLGLPWPSILVGGGDAEFSADVFVPGSAARVSKPEFRHYFASYFIRSLVLRTWWLGGLVGVWLIWRRGGGLLDLPWGLIAGAVAGLAVSATVASVFLVFELLPHLLWAGMFGGGGSVFHAIAWVLLTLICWTLSGLAVGAALAAIPATRRWLVHPFQHLFAGLFRSVGLARLADAWTPG